MSVRMQGLALCALLFATLGAALKDEAAQEISATIEQLRGALRALPQEPAPPSPAHVIDVVRAVVLPHVDVDLAGKLVMGRYWRDADAGQRQAFVDAYRELLLRMYGAQALDYIDAEVDFLPTQVMDDGQRQRVSTRVRRAGKPDVTVDYQLRRREGRLRVFDVVVNGVSVVITLRQTVGEDFARHGIDGVIERLRSRLASETPAAP